jgi:hypothetical protein
MKKDMLKSKNLYWILSVLMVFGFASCKKENANLVGGKGAPTITSVHTLSKTLTSTDSTAVTVYDTTGKASTTQKANPNPVVAFDSTTSVGTIGTQYVIHGTNLGSVTSVMFNGVAAYFNSALVSDNTIIVAVPSNAPFGSTQTNKITVTTLHGKVDYSFSILQPAPTLTSFAPLAGSANDTLTITGTVLDNATSVKFGTVPAKIVSNTSTQIKVLIPAGVVQSLIYVTTAGGTSVTTASFGFKLIVYDDALALGWGGNGGGYSGYNSVINFTTNTTNVKRGTHSIACQFTDPFGALQIGYGGATAINVAQAGLTAVKFSIYGGAGINTGDKVQVAINGVYGNAVQITLTAGAYTDFTIPLSSLGNPATIFEFVLQGVGVANPSTIYVDDIGFI